MHAIPNQMRWLELITAGESLRQNLATAVVPVNTGTRTCRVVQVNGRLLSSSQGAPTLFYDLPAARRFLAMIGLGSSDVASEPAPLDLSCAHAEQCFVLTSQGGLGVCPMATAKTVAAEHD